MCINFFKEVGILYSEEYLLVLGYFQDFHWQKDGTVKIVVSKKYAIFDCMHAWSLLPQIQIGRPK